MYKTFFGLKREPFSVAADPRFLYLSPEHREAAQHLLFGLQSGAGFILLTGEVGAGKTMVCRAFLRLLPPNADVANVVNPRMDFRGLLLRVCEDLHIDVSPTNPDLIDAIHGHLLLAHAQGRRTLIVVDEAQALSHEVLELLRLLTNLDSTGRKLQIFLIGQPELRTTLRLPALEPVSQRIVARYHLHSLPESETARYMEHRLRKAGLEGPLPFDEAAMKAVHRACRGIPRRINVLCDRAMLTARNLETRQIDAAMIERITPSVFDLPQGDAGASDSAAAPPTDFGRQAAVPPMPTAAAVARILNERPEAGTGSVPILNLTQDPAATAATDSRPVLTQAAPTPPVAPIAPVEQVTTAPQPPPAAQVTTPAPETTAAMTAAAAVPDDLLEEQTAADEPVSPIRNHLRLVGAACALIVAAVALGAVLLDVVRSHPAAARAAAVNSPSTAPAPAVSPTPAPDLQPPAASEAPKGNDSSAPQPSSAPVSGPFQPAPAVAAANGIQSALDAATANEFTAWRELAQLWGVTLPAGEPCAAAIAQGLRCQRVAGGLQNVRQLNRPGIIGLRAADGRISFTLLVGLSDTTASLRNGSDTRIVQLDELAGHWHGGFATFWRAPRDYHPETTPLNDTGMADWLRQQFAVVDGGPVPASAGALQQRIAAFQIANGLPPDGIAGPNTLIALNRASKVSEPQLER